MKPEYIILHHTVSKRDNTSIHDVNAWHKARWNWRSSMGHYMGYHFLVTGDGKIHQGAKPTEQRAHTIGYNDKAIGVCLTGNFETEKPSEKQLESLKKLLKKLMEQYNIKKDYIKGHREVYPTLCPGENFISWIKEWRLEELNKFNKKMATFAFALERCMLLMRILKGRKTK
jgi:N-acetyl-anhydromuramyl-L-alanine amidase AmpD